MSVATFYREFMAGLRGLGIEVRIWTTPVESPTPSPSSWTSSTPPMSRCTRNLFWRALVRPIGS